jgi:GntR family transcriptional regulator
LSRLSRASPEPLYRQLADRLEREIASGRLKPGDRIESEGLLAERFQVSRITVRQAVEKLVKQHKLLRKQGKGTFVTSPPVRHDLRRLHGLFGSLFSQADGASAKLLLYELQIPPDDTATAMKLRAGKPALALDRLYLIKGKPVALVQAWLVPEVAALPRAKASLISTEDMMREVGVHVASSQVAIRADMAGATVGKLVLVP